MNATKKPKSKLSAAKGSMGHLLPDLSQLDGFYFLTPSGLCYGPDPETPAVSSQTAASTVPRVEDWEGIARSYKSRLNAADGPVLVPDAGNGVLLDALRRQGLEVMGCEPSARLVQLARRKYGFDEHTFRCSEAESFLEWLNRVGRKAQAVFLCRTLEPFRNPKVLWRQIANVLDQDGLVIAQVEDDAAVMGQGMVNQNALVRTAAQCGLELENVDCNFANSFTAFVFKKTAMTQCVPGPLSPNAHATLAIRNL